MGLSSRYKELRDKEVPDFHNNRLLKECLSDEQLMSEVLVRNKEFALSIIKTYIGSIEYIRDKFDIEEEDLLQLAYIGITNALRTFDFDRNIKFTTYCYRPIIWEINPYIYKDTWAVPLSRSSVKLMWEMDKLANELGYHPSPEEFAKKLNVPVERILEVLMFAGNMVSLNSESMENSIDEVLKDPHEFEGNSLDRIYIDQLVEEAEFDDFEKKVVELMLKDYNNSRIAEELGVYPMTVNRAIEKMRNKASKEYLDKKATKYSKEVEIVAEEIAELGEVLTVEEIQDLLDVCGFDIDTYSLRVLYYIRQRAISISEENY